jgi:hypothetical protein
MPTTDDLITLYANLETILNDLDIYIKNVQEKRKLAADCLAKLKDKAMKEMDK